MRKILPTFVLACSTVVALSACNQSEAPPPAAVEQAPAVVAAPTLAAPVMPVKPAELVAADEAAAAAPAAPAAGGAEVAKDAAAKPDQAAVDPALADAKARYEAAMTQYEEQKKTYSNAWKTYLVSVVTANMQGVKSNHPYMYFVPGGNDPAAQSDRKNQLDNVTTVVSRGVLPGNMMAFGGPDSKITAQLVADAFKDVQAGALMNVVVLFIGTQTDGDLVKEAVATSGADYRFVEAK